MEYNLKDKYILQLNEKEKALETRDLNIFYGEKQALFDGNLQFERYTNNLMEYTKSLIDLYNI